MTPTPRFARWWWIGFSEGLRALLCARNTAQARHALRLLLCPIDLWRYYEVAAVLGACESSTSALDIGSPKIVAHILRAKNHTKVFATDIAWDALERPSGGMAPLQCDALQLPFADCSLPFVYSVSALEHIAECGDTFAIREIARVLVPGGVAVITVPLVHEYYERWIETDPYGGQARDAAGRVFFSRYYDWLSLEKRLLTVPELRVVELYAWQEKLGGWYDRYCNATARPLSARSVVTKILDPVWSARRIEFVKDGPKRLARHGIAAIVLRKQGGAGA